MAARKTAAGTALVVASPDPVIVNRDRKPNPADPHSLLELHGVAPGSSGLRLMYGILQACYRGHVNSAASFVGAKLRPSWSADPHAVTAAWSETLAPASVDDGFTDPMLLATRIDRELARDADGEAPLLAYATLTDPAACRIHVFREELRSVARGIVDAYGGPVICVIHAPGRKGSGAMMHGHLCICPVTTDGPLGFGKWIAPFCTLKGRQIVLDAWLNRKRFE